MRDVSSRILRPCSPRTSWVCVARMTTKLLAISRYSSCCFHTDICDCRSDSDFNTRVALLGEFSLEELVQFCVENTIGDELATLRDSALLGSHVGGVWRGVCRKFAVCCLQVVKTRDRVDLVRNFRQDVRLGKHYRRSFPPELHCNFTVTRRVDVVDVILSLYQKLL